MNVNELEGAELDAAVLRALGHSGQIRPLCRDLWGPPALLNLPDHEYDELFEPSTRWAHGGPIIERERIQLAFNPRLRDRTPLGPWEACFLDETGATRRYPFPHHLHIIVGFGPTPLIAAMRAFVASRQQAG